MTATDAAVFDARKWAAKFWSSFSAYSLLDNMFMDPYALQKFVPLPEACQVLPNAEQERILLCLQENTARDFAKIMRVQSTLMLTAAAVYFEALLKDFLRALFVSYPGKMEAWDGGAMAPGAVPPKTGKSPATNPALLLRAEAVAEEIGRRHLAERFGIIEGLTGQRLPRDLKTGIADILTLRDELLGEEQAEDLGRQKLLWVFSALPSQLLAALEGTCRALNIPFTSTAKHDLPRAA